MRQGNKIAVVLRENTGWMDGLYSLPAGRVEPGESIVHGAIREAKEEVGVTIKPSAVNHALTVHRQNKDLDWLDVYFEVLKWEGEIMNAEPEKHSAAAWLSIHDVLDSMIPPQRFALKQIAAGNHYAEYGW